MQGGTATETQTCPLWSDNKAIHEEAIAKAAEEAREKLKQENVTLDIDPLKGIAKPAAKQTKEEVKQGLFQRWYNMKAEVRFQENSMYNLAFFGSPRWLNSLTCSTRFTWITSWTRCLRHCKSKSQTWTTSRLSLSIGQPG